MLMMRLHTGHDWNLLLPSAFVVAESLLLLLLLLLLLVGPRSVDPVMVLQKQINKHIFLEIENVANNNRQRFM